MQFYITMIVFTLKLLFIIISYMYTLLSKQGRRDRMVVGSATTFAISAYYH